MWLIRPDQNPHINYTIQKVKNDSISALCSFLTWKWIWKIYDCVTDIGNLQSSDIYTNVCLRYYYKAESAMKRVLMTSFKRKKSNPNSKHFKLLFLLYKREKITINHIFDWRDKEHSLWQYCLCQILSYEVLEMLNYKLQRKSRILAFINYWDRYGQLIPTKVKSFLIYSTSMEDRRLIFSKDTPYLVFLLGIYYYFLSCS